MSFLYPLTSSAVLHELIASEQLAGTLRGRLDKAVYIPHVYTQSQNKWTDSFLATNGYLGKRMTLCTCMYVRMKLTHNCHTLHVCVSIHLCMCVQSMMLYQD